MVFIEPFNFSFFSITGWGIDLDFCDIEWFALEMNRDLSFLTELAIPEYKIKCLKNKKVSVIRKKPGNSVW